VELKRNLFPIANKKAKTNLNQTYSKQDFSIIGIFMKGLENIIFLTTLEAK